MKNTLFTSLIGFAAALRGAACTAKTTRRQHADFQANGGDHYIVQYHKNHDSKERIDHEALINSLASKHSTEGGIIRSFSIGGFQGYHARLSNETVESLRSGNHSHIIKSIYPDGIIKVTAVLPLPRSQGGSSAENSSSPSPLLGSANSTTSAPSTVGNIRTVQAGSWGQARISHRRPNATSYTYNVGGSTVYHIDTGVQLSHREFAGTDSDGQPRVRWGRNFVPGTPDTDENGHGTHTAGTIGGVTYGIAPRTRILAAKVFDGDGAGSWSGVLAALDWACADAQSKNATGLSVVNMSLGGGYYQPINDAVQEAVGLGLTVVVGAGNDGANVNGTSPASCAEAITVGATDQADARADFSNWGWGVDFFAPGVNILSAGIQGGDDGTAVMSGTSMAAPHVAGLAAYLTYLYGWHTPDVMQSRLAGLATRDVVVNAGIGSRNMLVFNGNIEGE